MSEYKELIKIDADNFVLVDKKEQFKLSDYQTELSALQFAKTLTRPQLLAAQRLLNPGYDVDKRIQDIQDLITECEAIE